MSAVRLITILLLVFAVTRNEGALDWWEDASLYQIYPRSFKDSDGDGVGDLNGITSRLEYLKEIGITATWLSPIFKSPMSDFGYDISNFTEIDPIFGTLGDFDALLAKAKRIGVRIILDFVPNHSSDECEWFQKSINREKGFEDFYVWDDGRVDPSNSSNRLPPSNWISVFGGPAWTWNDKRKQFYLHQFQVKQPDFNYRNPKVKAAMFDVLKYWLDRGVDGFRIDAVPHIFEKIEANGRWPDEPRTTYSDDPNSYEYLEHIYTKDQYETVELIYEWRAFLDDYQKKNGGDTRVLLAEAYSPINILDEYFGNSTHPGAQIPFNFALMGLNGQSTATDFANSIDSWMNVMWRKHKAANWVLGNHDNPRISDRFGNQKIDLINIILTGLPGASVTYYGEEIGMANVKIPCNEVSCEERNGERTPFQWNDDISAGFSTNATPWLPVADDYRRINVKRERGIARSHLNIYKGMQELKRTEAFKAFKDDDDSWNYGALDEQIFYIIRKTNREGYLILVNLGDKFGSYQFSEIVSQIDLPNLEYYLMNDHSPHYIGEKICRNRIFMAPYEAAVLRWRRTRKNCRAKLE